MTDKKKYGKVQVTFADMILTDQAGNKLTVSRGFDAGDTGYKVQDASGHLVCTSDKPLHEVMRDAPKLGEALGQVADSIKENHQLIKSLTHEGLAADIDPGEIPALCKTASKSRHK